MAAKIQNGRKGEKILQKSCYYSRIMEQILMFNGLVKKYFDWVKIKAKKNVFFFTNMAAKIQNGRKSKIIYRKVAITQELCNRFQCSIACLKCISIGLKFINLENFNFLILYHYGRQSSKCLNKCKIF